MAKLLQGIALFVLMVVVLAGCSGDRADNPMSSDTAGVTLQTANKITLPQGALFQYATLYLYCTQANGEPVNVHRVLEPWEEMVVTWENFGGAYDPTIVGTFTADTIGWKSVDISDLVIPWMNGSYENFGLLLDQVEEKFPWAIYNSREAGEFQPYIEVAYIAEDGSYIFETDLPLADTYIYETWPTTNFGYASNLRTGYGYFTEREKQSLLIFDIPLKDTPSDGGCTRTIGYWKTHAGFGKQDDMVTQYLPIWLGEADGAKSLYVADAKTAVDVLKMKTYGRPFNGITKLYAQLLAAKLNVAAGADDGAIADIITKADTFLAEYDWTDWWKLNFNKKIKVLRWMCKLDKYNNGIIGPGHCD
ncbi:MAG: DNRLRE domain-containing protein [Candidatus Zixiibacteriota bacterium]